MKSFEVNGVRYEFGKITVDSVDENPYKEGQYQAQIRQTVTKIYPGGGIGNSNADLLFEDDADETPDGQSFESIRVTWLPLAKERSVSDIQKQLRKSPDANIWKIISDDVEDILTEEQLVAAENEKYEGIDIPFYEEKFLIKGKDGEDLETDGYQQLFFSKKFKKDSDMRTGSDIKSTVPFSEVEEEVEVGD
jgi:hypothetical protein